jgi:hypothetical protein
MFPKPGGSITRRGQWHSATVRTPRAGASESERLCSNAKVVVYDDNLTKDAARIWWILRYWGVEDVRLLNGGWKAWEDGNYRTETTDAFPSPVEFVARARPERLATKERNNRPSQPSGVRRRSDCLKGLLTGMSSAICGSSEANVDSACEFSLGIPKFDPGGSDWNARCEGQ